MLHFATPGASVLEAHIVGPDRRDGAGRLLLWSGCLKPLGWNEPRIILSSILSPKPINNILLVVVMIVFLVDVYHLLVLVLALEKTGGVLSVCHSLADHLFVSASFGLGGDYYIPLGFELLARNNLGCHRVMGLVFTHVFIL
jgi:hypothetical protein